MAGAYPHTVLRPINTGNGFIAPGTVVDASEWRNREVLVSSGYMAPGGDLEAIEALPGSGLAVANSAPRVRPPVAPAGKPATKPRGKKIDGTAVTSGESERDPQI